MIKANRFVAPPDWEVVLKRHQTLLKVAEEMVQFLQRQLDTKERQVQKYRDLIQHGVPNTREREER
jgi:hypothetical protein